MQIQDIKGYIHVIALNNRCPLEESTQTFIGKKTQEN